MKITLFCLCKPYKVKKVQDTVNFKILKEMLAQVNRIA